MPKSIRPKGPLATKLTEPLRGTPVPDRPGMLKVTNLSDLRSLVDEGWRIAEVNFTQAKGKIQDYAEVDYWLVYR